MKETFTLNYLKTFSQKLLSLIKYGVAGIILAVPLYPKFPLFNIPGTRVAIRLEDFLILLVSLLWMVYALPNFKKILKDPIIRAIILFWAIGLFSVFSAIYLTQTVSPFVSILNWGRRVQYMVCFFIGMSVIKNKEDLMFYIKCFLIDIVYIFIVGMGQVFLHWPVITTQNDEYSKGLALFYMKGGHLVSTFAGHYDMAAFLLVLLPLLLPLIFARKNDLHLLFGSGKTVIYRILLVVISTFSVWLLTQAASRISLASYFGVATLTLIFNRRIRTIPFVLSFSLLIIVAFGGSVESRYLNLLDVLYKKVTSYSLISETYARAPLPPSPTPVVLVTPSPSPTPIPVVEDRSTNIRLAVEWPRAVRAFTKNIFLGTGYSSITLATDNDYLRILGEVGLLGALSFGLIFIRIATELLSVFKSKKQGIEKIYIYALLSGISGLILNLIFIDLLEASKFAIIFWLLLGFGVATARNLKD